MSQWVVRYIGFMGGIAMPKELNRGISEIETFNHLFRNLRKSHKVRSINEFT